ncbi:TPA: TVP38/TMEM64 family protein, partial [Vibrio cholerae]|nr:TVP38/TMEM64 family protein [Vibrio cholerae]
MYKKLIIAIVLIAIAALLVTQFSQYLTLDVAKAKQAELANYIDAHLLQAALIYFVVYVLLTAFSIPGATVVTLLGAA